MLGLNIKKAEAQWASDFPKSNMQDTTPEYVEAIFVGGKIVFYTLLEDQVLPENEKVGRWKK
jgi:hypothetical protein